MLPRDTQADQFLEKYFPKYDFLKFKQDLGTKPLVSILTYEAQDMQKMMNYYSFSSYMILATFISSGLLSMKFYNKIPLLRRVENRYFRFLWKSIILLLPTTGVSLYCNIKAEMLENELYGKYSDRYRKFKLNGNVKDLNPNVKSKKFLDELNT